MDFARKTLSHVGHCMSCSEDLLGPPEVEPEVEGRLEGAGFDDEEGRLLDGEFAGELRVSDWLERKASHLDRESFSLGALASCCTTSSKEVDGFFLLPPTPAPPILFRLFSPEVFGIALVEEGDEEFAAGESPCLLRTCRSQELRAWKDLGHWSHLKSK